MKRLILHIGRHKTATTSIQLFLARNREALRTAGIAYPMAGRDLSPGQSRENRAAHHAIAFALGRGDADAKNYIAAVRNSLLEEADGCSTIIVSSEAFQNVADMDLVKEAFADFSIETIGYLREYLSYVTSSYAHEIRGSDLATSFTFFEQKFNLQMRQFIDRWTAVSAKTVWRLYDREALQEGNAISDFVKTLDLPVVDDREETESNPSISGNLLGFKFKVDPENQTVV